jgi:hypothetical protein
MEVVKRGTVRRSKLSYLRKRAGKRALKVGMTEDLYLTDEDDVETPIEEELEKEEPKEEKEEKEEKVEEEKEVESKE